MKPTGYSLSPHHSSDLRLRAFSCNTEQSFAPWPSSLRRCEVPGEAVCGAEHPSPAARERSKQNDWGFGENPVLLVSSIPNEATVTVAWQLGCYCLFKEIN